MNNNKKNNTGYSELAIGMCIGVAIGTAIGATTHNMGLWISMGVSLGLCFGLLFSKKAKRMKQMIRSSHTNSNLQRKNI